MPSRSIFRPSLALALLPLLIAWSHLAPAADAPPGRAGSRFEPTVTKEESLLLNNAMTTAATNAALAIRMLRIDKLDKSSPALDFAIGNLSFQNDQLPEAEAAYRSALAKMPTFRSAILNLGRVYLLQDQPGQAIALYQDLAADGQADADTLLLLGHALLMDGFPVSAETAYRQTLLLRTKDQDAMLGLAKALMLQARYAEGLALVGELLQLDPTQCELWSLRANAFLSEGNTDIAARTIEQADRLGCARPNLLASLGDLYINRDQPEDALRSYQKAFRDDPPTPDRMLRALEGFLLTENTGGADRMIDRLQAALESSPDSFDPSDQVRFLGLQAELALQRAQPARAIALCQQVLRLDPLNGRTMLILAELEQREGRLEDAVMTCERAARIKGFEVEALVRQAQIEVSRERYIRAVPLLEAAQTFRDQPHVARYLEQVRRMVK